MPVFWALYLRLVLLWALLSQRRDLKLLKDFWTSLQADLLATTVLAQVHVDVTAVEEAEGQALSLEIATLAAAIDYMSRKMTKRLKSKK